MAWPGNRTCAAPATLEQLVNYAEPEKIAICFVQHCKLSNHGPEESLNRTTRQNLEGTSPTNDDSFRVDLHITSYTYSDLLRYSTDLASALTDIKQKHLENTGDAEKVIVGVSLKRCALVPVVLIGLSKAGLAFCPLDYNSLYSDSPLLTRENITYLITDDSYISKNFKDFETNYKLTLKDDITCKLIKIRSQPEATQNNNDKLSLESDLAYIMRTSGTTTRRRLVAVRNAGILENVKDLLKQFELKPSDVVLSVAPLTFDPFMIEVFLALGAGGTLVLTSDEIRFDSSLLAKVIHQTQSTILQCTPTHLQRLLDDPRKLFMSATSLRVLALGGEKCIRKSKLHELSNGMPGLKIYNIYGTTEVSCWASCEEANFSCFECDELGLGKPFSGIKMLTLPSSVSFEGEIVIGFDKSRECIVFDEETNQRLPFFDLPTVPGYKFLQTGDLGRMNMCSKCSDFNSLLFVERIDRLCKRNGTRVDLSLIESKAIKLEGIKQAHCFEWKDNLVLLVKPSESVCSNLGQEVHKALRNSLPIECQPDRIVVFDGVEPIGANGKLDVKTIMDSVTSPHEVSTNEQEDQNQIYHLKTEQVAALFDEMWQFYTKVTPSDKFVGDSFISCGGNSLSAVRFVEDFFAKVQKFGSKEHADNEKSLIRCLIFLSYEEAREEFVKFVKKLNYKVVVSKCGADTASLAGTGGCKKTVETASNGIRPMVSSKDVLLKFPLSTTDSIKYAIGLCVDATPVLFRNEAGATSCLIGSHSGDICCFNLESLDFEVKCCVPDNNVPVWKRKFSGRVESSVVLDSEGCAYVGCHSGDVVKLNASTGKTIWSFMLGFEVRSSPALDPLERYMVVCSTQHVYCIDAKLGVLIWVHKSDAYIPQNFSPLATKTHAIFATSKGLSSIVFNTDSGLTSWQTEHEAICTATKHVQSSATSVVVFGTGDGCVQAVNEATGEEIWRFDLLDHELQPSPPNELQVFHRNNAAYLLFSTHSGNIVCLEAFSGVLCGACNIGTACRSTPHVMLRNDIDVVQVIASSLNSRIYSCLFNLDTLKTEVEDVLAIFGIGNSECFSSPVVASDLGIIVVGCRDNCVYFFKLEQSK